MNPQRRMHTTGEVTEMLLVALVIGFGIGAVASTLLWYILSNPRTNWSPEPTETSRCQTVNNLDCERI